MLNRYYISFLLIIFAGLGAFYVVHFGYYPITFVNGEVVSAKELREEFVVAYQYYAKVFSGQDDLEINVNSREFKKELRRAALNDLIEKSLVLQGLHDIVGDKADALVESRINGQDIDSKSLKEAAETLYGITLADFTKMVLVPQARREVLEGRLFLEEQDIDTWLTEELSDAKVTILTPEFYWANNKVELRD